MKVIMNDEGATIRNEAVLAYLQNTATEFFFRDKENSRDISIRAFSGRTEPKRSQVCPSHSFRYRLGPLFNISFLNNEDQALPQSIYSANQNTSYLVYVTLRREILA
jgi:hypothetical protein